MHSVFILCSFLSFLFVRSFSFFSPDEENAFFESKFDFQENAFFSGLQHPSSPSSTRSMTALAKPHPQLFSSLLFSSLLFSSAWGVDEHKQDALCVV
jgi:hypothetical protein